MFEKDDDYYKAREESKDRITKVIKAWCAREEVIHDGGFEKGAEFGYNKANEYAKTIVKDLLDNSDEYARQRAMDFLEGVENEAD